jgi:ATP-dependent RNA circularization protein (DNA/RNA ligase family)
MIQQITNKGESMEYPKIETLFERDEKTHKVFSDKLRNPVYGIFKKWQFTEKIDGTNIRIIWSEGKLKFGGSTENANLPADLVQYLYEKISPEKLKEIFGDGTAVIYGEGYGAGIQKGGYYSPSKQFIVFDVLVDSKWWLNWENTCDIANKLGLKTVPFIGEMTLEEGIEMVKKGFNSVLAKDQTGQEYPAEGLVGRTVETLFDKKGHRIIIKLKTRDF